MRYGRLDSRIRTLIADTDEHNDERPIPIGTAGTVVKFDGDLYDIAWDNGARTRWGIEEIARDSERITEQSHGEQ